MIANRVSIPRSGFWLFGLDPRHPSGGGQAGFNPSIGILVVRTARARAQQDFARLVSIPRSGFWLFGLEESGGFIECDRCGFNPSIGILVVRTCPASSRARTSRPVSIPRSGFWLFGRDGIVWSRVSELSVSIPRSGFWLFGQTIRHLSDRCLNSFNPSIGILVVRTRGAPLARRPMACFNPSIGILVVRTVSR